MGNTQVVVTCFFSPLHEPRHRLPAALENARIVVCLPDRPGTNDACISPGRCEVVPVLEGIRGKVSKRTTWMLSFHQFTKPLGVECPHFSIVDGRGDIRLRIAGPTHALIALRTVGRQVNEVGTLRPDDVAVELVDHRIRCRFNRIFRS